MKKVYQSTRVRLSIYFNQVCYLIGCGQMHEKWSWESFVVNNVAERKQKCTGTGFT